MKKTTLLVIYLIAAVLLGSCSKNPQEKRAEYLASADNFVKQNKYAEASIQYQNALKIAPDDAETLVKLGEIQLLQQKPGEAFGSFMHASKVDAKNIKAHSNLATIYMLAKKYDEAIKEANILISLDPSNYRGKEILAQCLFLTGKKEESYNMLKGIIDKGNASEGVYVNAIQVLINSEKYDEALNLVNDGLKRFPNSTNLRMTACEIYQAKNMIEDAKKMAEEAYSISKGDINSGLFLIGFAEKYNMPDRVASVINELKKKYPNDYRIYILETEQARNKKDLDKAIEFAKKAAEVNYSEQTASLLAEQYVAKGNVDLAIQTLDVAISKYPNSTRLKLNLTRLLLDKGNSDKAQQTLDPLIKSMPDNLEVAMYAARLYLMKGEQERARSFVEKALQNNPNDPRLHALLATVHFRNAEYRDALTEVELTHKSGSSSVELLNIAVISSLNLGQSAKALNYIQLLKKAAPNEWATVYSEITYYISVKDIKSAYQLSEKAIKQWPDKMEALTIYAQTGPEIIGISSTIQGISSVCATRKSSNCMIVLSVLYEKAGMKNEALAKIKEAITKDPKNDELYYALADFYIRSGMTEQAITEFKNILNRKPDDVKSAVVLAILLQEKDDKQNAIKTYEYILEKAPSNTIAANNLAWMLTESGKKSDLDRAMDLATRAKRTDPDNPAIADTLGYVYFKKDMYAQARDQFMIALESNPDEPSYNYHMAQALVKDGKKKEAVAYLKKAANAPSFAEMEDAKKLLKSIGG